MSEPELRDWIDLARAVTDEDRSRFEPPDDLFDRLAAELEVDADAPAPFADPAAVIDLQQARVRPAPRSIRRRHRRLAVAAVAAAVVLVLGFSAFIGDQDTPAYVADAANIDPVNGEPLSVAYGGAATATVSGDRLAISFTDSLPDDDPLELWLLRPDGQGGIEDMVSLGLLDDQGSYEIPEGYDPSEYSLVDVSIEPADGPPTHSGRSILRGQLQAA